MTPWALAQQEPRGDDQDRGHRDLRNFGRDPALVGRTVRLAPVQVSRSSASRPTPEVTESQWYGAYRSMRNRYAVLHE